ncbi:HNH endonuclease, partial [Propionivibrio sp.]|uniref:HNH endonuclease n=1 Tax=Propionivibrio sp. TaxID=2212460 RepID=UPI003BF205F9
LAALTAARFVRIYSAGNTLYWLWSSADQHSEDGVMLGLTLRAIDRKVGVQGFGLALLAVGWIADHPEGVRIVKEDNLGIPHFITGVTPDRPLTHIWKEIRSRIFNRDDYTCRYCGERGKKLECDHVIPVSRGGVHTDDNLVTACFACNRSKRDKLVEEWKVT